MPTSLDALRDQNLRTRLMCLLCLLQRSNLTNHENPCIAKSRDDVREYFPEQGDHWNLEFDADLELLLEEARHGRGWNEIYPKLLRRTSAHGFDLAADKAWRFPNHTEDTEPSGTRDGHDELRSCHAAHAGQDDRILATK
jgi:hypothetical protein